ncbi:MAG TPA: helix-turn-helix transcriptional regulator, partial [Rubricoccaceae bacterium]
APLHLAAMPGMSRLTLPGTLQPHVAFGQAVRARREALGISQEALAERCDLDRTYVSGVERGRRNPTVQAVYRIAQGLDVAAAVLVADADAALLASKANTAA